MQGNRPLPLSGKALPFLPPTVFLSPAVRQDTAVSTQLLLGNSGFSFFFGLLRHDARLIICHIDLLHRQIFADKGDFLLIQCKVFKKVSDFFHRYFIFMVSGVGQQFGELLLELFLFVLHLFYPLFLPFHDSISSYIFFNLSIAFSALKSYYKSKRKTTFKWKGESL